MTRPSLYLRLHIVCWSVFNLILCFISAVLIIFYEIKHHLARQNVGVLNFKFCSIDLFFSFLLFWVNLLSICFLGGLNLCYSIFVVYVRETSATCSEKINFVCK